jgi:transposase-like protein
LSALVGDKKTLTELAQQFEVHPNQITDWKRQLSDRMESRPSYPQIEKANSCIQDSALIVAV